MSEDTNNPVYKLNIQTATGAINVLIKLNFEH